MSSNNRDNQNYRYCNNAGSENLTDNTNNNNFINRNTRIRYKNQTKNQVVETIETTDTNMFLRVKPRSNLYEWQEVFSNYARKTYGDAGEILKTKELPEYMKEEEPSIEVRGELKGLEAHMVRTKYDIAIKNWYDNRSEFNKNCSKLFGDILMHMSEEARIITTQRTEKYSEIDSEKDIIKLWEAIEAALGSNGQRNQSVFSQMQASAYLQKLKQRPGQPLHIYEKEFNRRLQICKSTGDKIQEKQLVLIYLSSLDRNIFESKVRYFIENESDKHIFPKTIQDAKDKIRIVYQSYLSLHMRQSSNNHDGSNNRRNVYDNDGVVNHAKRINNVNNNGYNDNSDNNNRYANIKCSFCDDMGHSAQVCEKLKQSKKVNMVNETNNDEQKRDINNDNRNNSRRTNYSNNYNNNTSNNNQNDNNNRKKVFFSGSNFFSGCIVAQCEEDKDCANNNVTEILDTGSNITLFTNCDQLSEVRDAEEPMVIRGVNGLAPLKLTRIGIHPDWGKVYLYHGNVNIISFKKVKDMYDMKYIESKDMFRLKAKCDDKIIEFKINKDGLYERTTITNNNNINNMVSTKYKQLDNNMHGVVTHNMNLNDNNAKLRQLQLNKRNDMDNNNSEHENNDEYESESDIYDFCNDDNVSILSDEYEYYDRIDDDDNNTDIINNNYSNINKSINCNSEINGITNDKVANMENKRDNHKIIWKEKCESSVLQSNRHLMNFPMKKTTNKYDNNKKALTLDKSKQLIVDGSEELPNFDEYCGLFEVTSGWLGTKFKDRKNKTAKTNKKYKVEFQG